MTDGYEISTDPRLLDLELVHRHLSEESYWARGVSRETVERSIESSLCFGIYRDGAQVGFARAVTDRATFAWLADVFILPEHRDRRLGVRLVAAALSHPELQTVRRWVLATADAHELYRRFGFEEISGDARFMVAEPAPAEGWAKRAEAGTAD